MTMPNAGQRPSRSAEKGKITVPPKLKRYVISTDQAGKSGVVTQELTNEQGREGFYWRSTLWATNHFPPHNGTDEDISADVITREPLPGGLIFRALEIAPDHEDAELHRRVLAELNSAVGQRVRPSDADLARHPNMHRTRTLDFTTCVRGRIYLVTDTDEVLMTPGDTVYLVILNAFSWMNAVLKSFSAIGASVTGLPALNPQSVLKIGINPANIIFNSPGNASMMTNSEQAIIRA